MAFSYRGGAWVFFLQDVERCRKVHLKCQVLDDLKPSAGSGVRRWRDQRVGGSGRAGPVATNATCSSTLVSGVGVADTSRSITTSPHTRTSQPLEAKSVWFVTPAWITECTRMSNKYDSWPEIKTTERSAFSFVWKLPRKRLEWWPALMPGGSYNLWA